jgi:hypothetical protein
MEASKKRKCFTNCEFLVSKKRKMEPRISIIEDIQREIFERILDECYKDAAGLLAIKMLSLTSKRLNQDIKHRFYEWIQIKSEEFILRLLGTIQYRRIGDISNESFWLIVASSAGYRNVMDFVIDELGETYHAFALVQCVVNGHVECMNSIIERSRSFKSGITIPSDVTNMVIYAASNSGRVDCLKILANVGIRQMDLVAKVACLNGDMETLKYAVDGMSSRPCEYIANAARNGHIECIKYLISKGFDYEDEAYRCAARNDHLECLELLFNRDPDNLLLDICSDAAENGSIRTLKYLHKKGFGFDLMTCSMAASSNSVECVKYVVENGGEWGYGVTSHIAENGNLELLKYVHQNGCPWCPNTPNSAILGDSVSCLIYAIENGDASRDIARWVTTAARDGSIECLKYLVQFNPPRRYDACRLAAHNGHINCLRFLHENKWPWNEETCQDAAMNGHLECLKYACENGCKPHVQKWKEKPIDVECFEYLASKGYVSRRKIGMCVIRGSKNDITFYLE